MKFQTETTDSAILLLQDSFSSFFTMDKHSYSEASRKVKVSVGGLAKLFGLEMEVSGGYKRQWCSKTSESSGKS